MIVNVDCKRNDETVKVYHEQIVDDLLSLDVLTVDHLLNTLLSVELWSIFPLGQDVSKEQICYGGDFSWIVIELIQIVGSLQLISLAIQQFVDLDFPDQRLEIDVQMFDFLLLSLIFNNGQL